MRDMMQIIRRLRNSSIRGKICPEQGFSLAEFMIATFILLVIAGSVFSLLSQTERTASYQSEIQGVLENTRIAMETIERIVKQACNDPQHSGFVGVTITSATEVRLRSDLTGSAGAGAPDKGDPDGDTSDSGEDVTIRYNAGTQSVELVPNGGTAQPIASGISAFNMQYLDRNGAATNVGGSVSRIRVTVTGRSPLPDPQTGRIFSLQLTSDVKLANRQ